MSSSLAQIKLGRQLRRSKRLALSVPVEVYGQDAFGESFREFTRMLSVNAHGGLLALAARVQTDQTVFIVNTKTREEQEFRVVHVGELQDGKWRAGIEFVHGAADFWRIYFPRIPSRRPLNTGS